MDSLGSGIPPIKGSVKSIKVKFRNGSKLKKKFGDKFEHSKADKHADKLMKGK